MKTQLRVGLIGYGYWGPNLLRNLLSHRGIDVVGVYDKSSFARQRCRKAHPHLKVFSQIGRLLESKPDAAVIATPPDTHTELALQCLEANLHLLVEKPLAMTTDEADKIIQMAHLKQRSVMVDHTFVYHPAVQYLHHQVRSGRIGDLLYYDSVRVNLGGYQTGANVILDLAPHDLSILDLITEGQIPKRIYAFGAQHFSPKVQNLGYIHLEYDNNFVAHLNLNWVAPTKIRTVTVGGSKKMIIYDDNIPNEKIRVYNSGVRSNEFQNPHSARASYRVGDMIAPAIPHQEALSVVIDKFYDLLANNKRPQSDAACGKRIVAIMEAILKSLETNEVSYLRSAKKPQKKNNSQSLKRGRSVKWIS